jgi:2-polyprenyl-3-methyl-5-hydroxy-6-metoxy-1,4-benzoquinol methylase
MFQETSQLGTKDYWESYYKRDLNEFIQSEIVEDTWFGNAAYHRIKKWILNNVPKTASILDIGCGNGSLLVDWYDNGYNTLTGIDYAPSSIGTIIIFTSLQSWQKSYAVIERLL